jgi:hypothetical protein
MQIVTDSESADEETVMLVVCNAPREGGGFAVALVQLYQMDI